MKTQFTKYGTAVFAALSLMALTMPAKADDDDKRKKKHDDHEHKEDHQDRKKAQDHHDRMEAKEDHHKGPDHRVIVDKHPGPDVVIDKGRPGPDHRVIVDKHPGPDRVIRPGVVGPKVVVNGPRVVRHPGYVLRLGDGYRGHGWYYGPPNVRYYKESPDVVYYESREAAPAEYAESRDAAVQRVLTEKGYYDGAVDGELGPMSHRAIAKYQSDNNLPATGEVNEALLNSLGIN